MRNNKKGITLIALVITIIVLLILAGVSISMLSGENSILVRGAQSKQSTDNAQLNERVNLAYTAAITNGNGKITQENLEAELAKEFGTKDTDWSIADGTNASEQAVWEITIGTNAPVQIVKPSNLASGGSGSGSGSGNASSARALLTPAPTAANGRYNEGDEVTLGTLGTGSGEAQKFFVLSDDGTNVKLLAKYCLSKTDSIQLDETATYSDYGRIFSKTTYWTEITGITYTNDVYELQSEAGLAKLAEKEALTDSNKETAENNAIVKAREYGQTIATATGKTVTGRLMTYEEASGIQNASTSGKTAEQTAQINKMKNILWGKWDGDTKPTEGYLRWWLGAAGGTDCVWFVDGISSYLDNDSYDITDSGVRPVLEI